MKEFAKRWDTMQRSCDTLKIVINSMTDPNVLSFGGGAPAKEALPVDIVHEIANDVLTEGSRGLQALQYGTAKGLLDLREGIVESLLAPKGIPATADDLVITGGGMEAVCIICATFLNPGDVILVESPTFFHCMMTFEMYEAKCIPCATDENGLVMEDVEAKIKEYHPKMIYTIPTFQNPTGITMSAERRKRLAELAAEYDVLVLEDDPYRDIRFIGEDVPAIKSFDTSGNVIMANSLSKIFSPGSRLGYIVADQRFQQKFCDAKTAMNTHTNVLCQVLASEFFKRGYYPDHHKKICDLYRERREFMLKCIDEHFPEGTKHTYPEGGLYTWVELPEGYNTTELLAESLNTCKIVFVAGEGCFAEGNGYGSRYMRLNFASVPMEIIASGIQQLGEMICAYPKK
ncbi:PLP-dependent aminotransferase family protein [Chakrabartyella piscis]|uniref:aminotransferase-like domain-containing protein n=1 Tax=Chakrabartyella piscis TaxID=2918914 RepID=UPI002958BE1B|nr:PLP-dependent aminotransferase family protein [Chakrabartyella piscis]